jgi:hypothetical protein
VRGAGEQGDKVSNRFMAMKERVGVAAPSSAVGMGGRQLLPACLMLSQGRVYDIDACSPAHSASHPPHTHQAALHEAHELLKVAALV